MKTILNLEEWGIFLLCIFLFSRLPFAWWWFPALLLLPDIGMIGYLAGPKVGAFTYNLLHHRAIAGIVAAYALWSGKTNWHSPPSFCSHISPWTEQWATD